jgi:UDP-N-acetyl-2-amino-2-deoxyglucuronate dehydrogenase
VSTDHRPRNFAVIGVGGFIAPRHLQAICATGNQLVAAVDPSDSVGVLDRYSFSAQYFSEIERFDRHLEKLRRGPGENRVHFVSVCSPNYLHDAHVRLALRVGADVICEKPLVINPWNLDALQEIEQESGRRIWTVLQLRLHPALAALKSKLASDPPGRVHDVVLSYVSARGAWYAVSWKGSEERSGGVILNIGIHFFDMLQWLFGRVVDCEVHLREVNRAAGFLRLERANVRWFLSTAPGDLPFTAVPGSRTTFRSIRVDDTELEFSDGFVDLHTKVYQDLLNGGGFGIDDARPSIEVVHRIRHEPVRRRLSEPHPFVLGSSELSV